MDVYIYFFYPYIRFPQRRSSLSRRAEFDTINLVIGKKFPAAAVCCGRETDYFHHFSNYVKRLRVPGKSESDQTVHMVLRYSPAYTDCPPG